MGMLWATLAVGWFLPGVLFTCGFAQLRDEDGTQMIGEYLFDKETLGGGEALKFENL